jgi:hypothetical protein
MNNHMDENDLQEVDRATALGDIDPVIEAEQQVNEEQHRAYADGLRAIADLYEQHPEIPLPWMNHDNYAVDTKAHAKALARALGTFKKEGNDSYLHIIKKFGPIEAKFVFTRDSVCTKRVVGVETIPARFVEAHTVEARTQEIVEWDCPSLLVDEEKSDG